MTADDRAYVAQLGDVLRTRDVAALRAFLEAQAGRYGDTRQVEAIRAQSDAELEALLGEGWIGRRAWRELAGFASDWNAAHPGEPLELVGLDAQDNAPAREELRGFVREALDAALAARCEAVLARIASADDRALLFGPSDVAPDDGRFLRELLGLPGFSEHLDAEAVALAADGHGTFAWIHAFLSDVAGGDYDAFLATPGWLEVR